MRVPLARMARAAGMRRSQVALRPTTIPATLASNLLTIYRPAFTSWEAAIPTILAAYERTLAEMTTDAPEDIGGLIGQVESGLLGVFLQIRPRLAEWAAKVERAHRRKWAASVLAGAKVDISTMIGAGEVRQTLGAVVEANVALVRSVSDEARRRISDAVFRGFQRRATAAEVAKELREAVGMARRRARLIAGDQASKLGSQLNDERRRQAGITQWEWVHSGKRHPRPEHQARDGNVYGEDDLLSDRPGMAIHCGCTSRAVLDIDAMIAAELEAA